MMVESSQSLDFDATSDELPFSYAKSQAATPYFAAALAIVFTQMMVAHDFVTNR